MDRLFGNLFDLDGDGELDAFEKATEFSSFINPADGEDGYSGDEDIDFDEDEF